MEVLFGVTVILPPAAWAYCSRVLIKVYREEIIDMVERYEMTRDSEKLYKDLRSMKYRPAFGTTGTSMP
jgi:hypothetical protein